MWWGSWGSGSNSGASMPGWAKVAMVIGLIFLFGVMARYGWFLFFLFPVGFWLMRSFSSQNASQRPPAQNWRDVQSPSDTRYYDEKPKNDEADVVIGAAKQKRAPRYELSDEGELIEVADETALNADEGDTLGQRRAANGNRPDYV